MAGSLLKYMLATAGYYSGLLRFVFCVRLNKRAIILMYHRVTFPEKKEIVRVQPGMYVTPKTFCSHLKLLQSEFHIISFLELVERIKMFKLVNITINRLLIDLKFFRTGSFMITNPMNRRRLIEQAFPMQGQKQFPTGHVIKTSTGLDPVLFLAQHS